MEHFHHTLHPHVLVAKTRILASMAALMTQLTAAEGAASSALRQTRWEIRVNAKCADSIWLDRVMVDFLACLVLCLYLPPCSSMLHVHGHARTRRHAFKNRKLRCQAACDVTDARAILASRLWYACPCATCFIAVWRHCLDFDANASSEDCKQL